MGFRYLIYRIRHELEKKFGILKNRHPFAPDFRNSITLEAWRKTMTPFFFSGKDIPLKPTPSRSLKRRVEAMKKGEFVFFGKLTYQLGTDYDWVTNPDSGYQYDVNEHWSAIQDLSEEKGDIKFVWEKARFAFLTDIIRYDFHHQDDQSEFVFNQIMDFIEKNPINGGPNYRCSQEISLRILNWSLALNYYKDSENLTEERFAEIMHSIFWQLHHVYHHIDFSRIAVRNNHAITETLMLYLSRFLFPFFPETTRWSKDGKKWFEEEIEYQIYPDGTFLQFSMNYHRVVVQLLTWAIRLSEINNESLSPVVRDRAERSLQFLDASMDPVSGRLPNYGNNDGALFFRWTEDDFRVYTSQLNDLRAVLTGSVSKFQESQAWYGMSDLKIISLDIQGIHQFKKSGYYIQQENDVKTFIRCGSYKDRPSQSDNLHLDIWKGGINFLWDTGTYKYNTSKELVNFFTGAEGHNTLALQGKNQMLRGSRFIWYYWIRKATGQMSLTPENMIFEGSIEAFQYIKEGIIHTRKVRKELGANKWLISDYVSNADGLERSVYWHVNPAVQEWIEIRCISEHGDVLTPIIEEKWHSDYYGSKEKSVRFHFRSNETMITVIKIK